MVSDDSTFARAQQRPDVPCDDACANMGLVTPWLRRVRCLCAGEPLRRPGGGVWPGAAAAAGVATDLFGKECCGVGSAAAGARVRQKHLERSMPRARPLPPAPAARRVHAPTLAACRWALARWVASSSRTLLSWAFHAVSTRSAPSLSLHGGASARASGCAHALLTDRGLQPAAACQALRGC